MKTFAGKKKRRRFHPSQACTLPCRRARRTSGVRTVRRQQDVNFSCTMNAWHTSSVAGIFGSVKQRSTSSPVMASVFGSTSHARWHLAVRHRSHLLSPGADAMASVFLPFGNLSEIYIYVYSSFCTSQPDSWSYSVNSSKVHSINFVVNHHHYISLPLD